MDSDSDRMIPCPCDGEDSYCEVRDRYMPKRHIYLCRTDPRYRRSFNRENRGSTRKPKPLGGPGTELTKLLSKVGIVYTATCQCRSRAMTMDKWGVEGCKEQMGTIVDWMAEEAKTRGLLFNRAAGIILVHVAIRRAAKRAKEQGN